MFNKIKYDKLLLPAPSKVILSKTAVSFITQLLTKDRFKRLGAKGDASQVLSHPWLKDIVLKDINDKNVVAEYIPAQEKPKDILSQIVELDGQEDETEVQESLVPYHIKSLI
jgi:serine/threonine protein kinase